MPKAHEPTDETRKKVESYSAVGIPQEDIARILRIDPKTLRLHYREELDTAAALANAAIGGALFNKAKGGDTTAMIWWSKTRMGWSDRTEINHSGSIDGQTTTRVVFEFTDEVEEPVYPKQLEAPSSE